jgi:uncharacterized protein (TIGR00299 family) protein
MSTLYFDCFSGISGDMTVGALIDVGVPGEYVISELGKLGISDEYEIKIGTAVKCGINGTDFDVILKEHHHHDHDEEHEHHHHHGRTMADIEHLIRNSSLNENVKELAVKMFLIVAEAESKVHGQPIDQVHFHEVGAVDSIVDIVGAAICIDYLKPDKVLSSPVNTGRGFVKCQHGLLPVPAPATLNILQDIPVYCDEREMELTTPTGAAIIKALATGFARLPDFKVKKSGYGCGKRNTEKPNLLRVMLGEDSLGELCLLQATIDDMNPQIYGHLMDRLFEAGARDVYYTPIYMKKNRPGIVVTITAATEFEEAVKEVMFSETTTIGIRKINIDRTELDRKLVKVSTSIGDISCKICSYKGKVVNISPEYEEVKKAAAENNIAFKQAYNSIIGQINIDK